MEITSNKQTQNKEKDYLSFLTHPKKRQELNALLHIYRLYKNIIVSYLDNPTNPANEDINIFYIRELSPNIIGLVKELKLDDHVTFLTNKPPLKYILFSSLLVSEQEIKDSGKNSDDVRKEVFSNYGTIKEVAEQVGAVGQTPIKKIEDIINKGQELIYISEINETRSKENTLTNELKIGPLKYKDFSIFYNESKLELIPQEIKLCRLFIESSLIRDTFIPDNVICDHIVTKGHVSKINMMKLVSKLRRTLFSIDENIQIERVTDQGYIFITKNIR